MLLVYPAIFHVEENSYWAEFPDLQGCHTFGETIEETVCNAKEALEGYCITVLESGQKLPLASNINTLQYEGEGFTTLIDCALKNTTHRAVKKTLTIQYWLSPYKALEHL